MIQREELEAAIYEHEKAPLSYGVCEKLATFYTIHDHLFNEKTSGVDTKPQSEFVTVEEKSDFCKVVNGKESKKVLEVLDELMATTEIINPKLYYATLEKLNKL